MKTIFYKGCEYKQGVNDLFFWKSSLNQWKKSSNQREISKAFDAKDNEFIYRNENEAMLLDLLKIRPATASEFTKILKISMTGSNLIIRRLKARGLVEKTGNAKTDINGRSPVVWGLVA